MATVFFYAVTPFLVKV